MSIDVNNPGIYGPELKTALSTILDLPVNVINITQTVSGGSNDGTLFNANSFYILDEYNDISNGLNFFYAPAGSTWLSPKTAVSIFADMSTNPAGAGIFSNNNMTALAASAAGTTPITDSHGTSIGIFGINPYVWLAAGATGYFALVGAEINVGISDTASAAERIGMQVISSAPQGEAGGIQGDSLDVAYVIGKNPGAAVWRNGVYWYADSFDSSSSIVSGAATNADYGIDFSNVTFNTAAFKSTNFLVDKSGNISCTLLQTGSVAVGSLPSAVANPAARYMVNNSSVAASGNFGEIVAAGAGNIVPVYSDGTNWRIG